MKNTFFWHGYGPLLLNLYGKISQGTQFTKCSSMLSYIITRVSGTEDERVVAMNPKLKEGRRARLTR